MKYLHSAYAFPLILPLETRPLLHFIYNSSSWFIYLLPLAAADGENIQYDRNSINTFEVKLISSLLMRICLHCNIYLRSFLQVFLFKN